MERGIIITVEKLTFVLKTPVSRTMDRQIRSNLPVSRRPVREQITKQRAELKTKVALGHCRYRCSTVNEASSFRTLLINGDRVDVKSTIKEKKIDSKFNNHTLLFYVTFYDILTF